MDEVLHELMIEDQQAHEELQDKVLDDKVVANEVEEMVNEIQNEEVAHLDDELVVDLDEARFQVQQHDLDKHDDEGVIEEVNS